MISPKIFASVATVKSNAAIIHQTLYPGTGQPDVIIGDNGDHYTDGSRVNISRTWNGIDLFRYPTRIIGHIAHEYGHHAQPLQALQALGIDHTALNLALDLHADRLIVDCIPSLEYALRERKKSIARAEFNSIEDRPKLEQLYIMLDWQKWQKWRKIAMPICTPQVENCFQSVLYIEQKDPGFLVELFARLLRNFPWIAIFVKSCCCNEFGCIDNRSASGSN